MEENPKLFKLLIVLMCCLFVINNQGVLVEGDVPWDPTGQIKKKEYTHVRASE